MSACEYSQVEEVLGGHAVLDVSVGGDELGELDDAAEQVHVMTAQHVLCLQAGSPSEISNQHARKILMI